jgi:hypothetical protein
VDAIFWLDTVDWNPGSRNLRLCVYTKWTTAASLSSFEASTNQNISSWYNTVRWSTLSSTHHAQWRHSCEPLAHINQSQNNRRISSKHPWSSQFSLGTKRSLCIKRIEATRGWRVTQISTAESYSNLHKPFSFCSCTSHATGVAATHSARSVRAELNWAYLTGRKDWTNSFTSPGLESATFRIVAQCLNHYATEFPFYFNRIITKLAISEKSSYFRSSRELSLGHVSEVWCHYTGESSCRNAHVQQRLAWRTRLPSRRAESCAVSISVSCPSRPRARPVWVEVTQLRTCLRLLIHRTLAEH